MLIFHLIADLTVPRAIDASIVMASSMCAEGACSTSPNAFRDRVLSNRET